MFASPVFLGWLGIYVVFGFAQFLACMVFGHRFRKAGWYFHFLVMWMGTPMLLAWLYGWEKNVVIYNTLGVTVFVMAITLFTELWLKRSLWFQFPPPKDKKGDEPSRDRRNILKLPSRHRPMIDKRVDDPLARLPGESVGVVFDFKI